MLYPFHQLDNLTYGLILFMVVLISRLNCHPSARYSHQQIHSQGHSQQSLISSKDPVTLKSPSGPTSSFLTSSKYFSAKSSTFSQVKSLTHAPSAQLDSSDFRLAGSQLVKKDYYAPNDILKQNINKHGIDRHQIKNIDWYGPKLQKDTVRSRPPDHDLNQYGLQELYGSDITSSKYQSAVLSLSPNVHKSTVNVPPKPFTENKNSYKQNFFNHQNSYNPPMASSRHSINNVHSSTANFQKKERLFHNFHPTRQHMLTSTTVKNRIGYSHENAKHGLKKNPMTLNTGRKGYSNTGDQRVLSNDIQSLKIRHNGQQTPYTGSPRQSSNKEGYVQPRSQQRQGHTSHPVQSFVRYDTGSQHTKSGHGSKKSGRRLTHLKHEFGHTYINGEKIVQSNSQNDQIFSKQSHTQKLEALAIPRQKNAQYGKRYGNSQFKLANGNRGYRQNVQTANNKYTPEKNDERMQHSGSTGQQRKGNYNAEFNQDYADTKKVVEINNNRQIYESAVSNVGGKLSQQFIISKEYIHESPMKVNDAKSDSSFQTNSTPYPRDQNTKQEIDQQDSQTSILSNGKNSTRKNTSVQHRRFGSSEFIKHLVRNGHVQSHNKDIHEYIINQKQYSPVKSHNNSVPSETENQSTWLPNGLIVPGAVITDVVEINNVQRIIEPKVTATKQKVMENVVRNLSSPPINNI